MAGSVAVGKSTTARVLQALLARWDHHPRVDLVTTDGFLHPSTELVRRNITSALSITVPIPPGNRLADSFGKALATADDDIDAQVAQ